jgi:hypothetical protein
MCGEHPFEGRNPARGEFTQPDTHQSLDLFLFLSASGTISLRRLRIKRDRYRLGWYHGNPLGPTYVHMVGRTMSL